MGTTVLDCSHFQHVSDWPAVRRFGVAAVLHKFSQGTSYRDPSYAEHRAAALPTGMLWGRYHFGTGEDVEKQVENFLADIVPGEALALDFEANPGGPTMSLPTAKQFVSLVWQRAGILPILYAGYMFKRMLNQGADSGILGDCRLWLSQWGPRAVLPAAFDHYYLWQYSATGKVPGIEHEVDLSMFDGTTGELQATWEAGDV